MNFGRFDKFLQPFPHWVAPGFLSEETVSTINRQWPDADYPGWRIETGRKSKKSSILFPARLPGVAQSLAEAMMAPNILEVLSDITGIELVPDPWFRSGPEVPRLGGGMHEIHAGGLLGMHLDFNDHPSGLTRCLNLLIYLNEDWQAGWGGALELHGDTRKTIYPFGGTAVLFQTTDKSWHGHPHPLTCPPEKSRRSMALYYYRREAEAQSRPKTVYR